MKKLLVVPVVALAFGVLSPNVQADIAQPGDSCDPANPAMHQPVEAGVLEGPAPSGTADWYSLTVPTDEQRTVTLAGFDLTNPTADNFPNFPPTAAQAYALTAYEFDAVSGCTEVAHDAYFLLGCLLRQHCAAEVTLDPGEYQIEVGTIVNLKNDLYYTAITTS